MAHEIKIFGFRSNIEDVSRLLSYIKEISQGCILQIVRAEAVGGKKHALHAVNQALLSFEREENIAQDIGLEIGLRISAQRQITRAIDILGIRNGKQEICAIMVGGKPEIIRELENCLGKRDDAVINPHEGRLKELYGITGQEINIYDNIENVMIERTSLLSLEK
jgi:KEOPS complex subunit Cgi121